MAADTLRVRTGDPMPVPTCTWGEAVEILWLTKRGNDVACPRGEDRASRCRHTKLLKLQAKGFVALKWLNDEPRFSATEVGKFVAANAQDRLLEDQAERTERSAATWAAHREERERDWTPPVPEVAAEAMRRRDALLLMGDPNNPLATFRVEDTAHACERSGLGHIAVMLRGLMDEIRELSR
jgi:hypothetical protein